MNTNTRNAILSTSLFIVLSVLAACVHQKIVVEPKKEPIAIPSVPISYQQATTKFSLPTKYRIGALCTPEPDCDKDSYIDYEMSVSPDGHMIGYIIMEPATIPLTWNETVVIADEKKQIHTMQYKESLVSPPVFSPDGKHYAYSVWEKHKQNFFVVKDGVENKHYTVAKYDEQKPEAWPLIQLQPAKHVSTMYGNSNYVAFTANNDVIYVVQVADAKQQTLVVGTKEISLPYNINNTAQLMNNGNIAYQVTQLIEPVIKPSGQADFQQYQLFAVHDCTIKFPQANCPILAKQEYCTGYPQQCVGGANFTKVFMVIIDQNGKIVQKSPPANLDESRGFSISPDGSTVAYFRQKNGNTANQTNTIHIEDSKGHTQEYSAQVQSSTNFIFSTDGSSFATVTEKWAGATPTDTWLVINGKEVDHHINIGTPVFSPDGQKIAYEAADGSKGAQHIIRNIVGNTVQVIGKTPESEVFEPWSFNTSGTTLLSVLRDDKGQSRVLINETRGKLYDDIIVYPFFINKDANFAYVARNGSDVWWIVEPVKQAEPIESKIN